jgi:uncharacterized membrane protein
MAKKPTRATSNVTISSDYLVYLSIIPFLLPLIYCLYNNSMTYIGGWYVSWSISFIILLAICFKPILLKLDQLVFSNKSLMIFFGLVLASFSYTTISKYLAFYTPSRDPGIFFSMIQAMLAGNFGFSSVAGIYHFGTHQNYILILLAPFYAIFGSPIFLQFIGGAATWGAGIILWKITRLYFNQFIALCCVVAFYASPSNHFYGFRPELFYPLALFLLYYVCVTQNKLVYIILATLFLLSVKEDAPLYIPGYIYLLCRKKDYKATFIVVAIAIATVLLNILIVQPYFVHKSGQQVADTLGFFNQWGANNHEIMLNLLSSPLKIISLFFDSNSGFWYTFGFWLFIPLLSPFLLLSAVLPLTLFAISNVMRMHVLSEYYAITPSALAYLGTICSLHMINCRVNNNLRRYLNIAIVFFLLIHNLLFVRFMDLMQIDYSQLSSDQEFALFTSAPMSRGRWQEFFPINSQDTEDFNKLRQSLKDSYKDNRICPTSQVYPHLDYRDFPQLQPFGGENANQSNCVNVFAIIGDILPIAPDSLNNQIMTMTQTQKCNRFGNFFYCDNLAK